MPAAKRQKATIPAVRMFSDELESIKSASTAQKLTLSEFIRRALLKAVPKPTRPLSLPSDSETENGTSPSSANNKLLSNQRRGRVCVHGFRVLAQATQCPTCANLGIQYKYQYD